MARGNHALRRLGLACVALTVGGVFLACVGDDPLLVTGATGGDAAAPETGSTDAGADAADAAPEPPTVVASGLAEPVSLAIAAQTAIILTETKLLRCPQKGCIAPAVLGDNLKTVLAPVSPRPYMIDADEGTIHWISQSATAGNAKFWYFRCNLTSGCPGLTPEYHPYMTEILAPVGLALGPDGSARIGQKGAVLSCDGTTCTPIAGVDVDATRAFAVDGTTVIYTDQTDPPGTYKATAGTTGSAALLHSTVGHVVAVQGADVYALTPTKIVACAKAGCSGIPRPIVDGEVSLTSMAVDSTGVYWTSEGASVDSGSVRMCPLSGCSGAPRILASGQVRPTSVRLRGGTVYWLNRGTGGSTGELMRAGQ